MVATDAASPAYTSNCEPPTIEEIRTVIRELRNNKAPGEDDLPPELFKDCPDVLSHWMQRILHNIGEARLYLKTGTTP